MQIININKAQKFYDPDTNKYLGFAGNVKIYKKEIYVDTRNGNGYDKVIKELDKYIKHMSFKYNLSNLGFTLEDTKQHIIMRILEGIPKYDDSKDMSLSTFLHMRVERRIINEIRDLGADSKNPTILKTSLYSVFCDCGRKFMISTGGNEKIEDKLCYGCEKPIADAKIFSINMPPESLNALHTDNIIDGGGEITIDDIISESNIDISMVFEERPKLENLVMFKSDFDKMVNGEDNKMQELIKLICLNDYTIKAAAEKIGISHTGASNRLRRLQKKKIVKEMLGK